MTCENCGYNKNNNEALFCAQCGNELIQNESQVKTKPCSSCHFENPIEAQFCAKCGIDVRHPSSLKTQHRHKGQKHQPTKKDTLVNTQLKWHPALVLGIILAVGLMLLSIPFFIRSNADRKAAVKVVEIKSSDSALEANVLAVANNFICSCGKCGEKPLDICKCETAIRERQFIREALTSGKKQNEVVAAVNTTFGWMKPEVAAAYDSTERKKGVSTKLTIPNDLPIKEVGQQNANKSIEKVATLSDREEIFGHFRCPCGQCGMDDLRTCNCEHSHGAKEVKAFVDGKIREGTFTASQLVDLIDKKFGGRKL